MKIPNCYHIRERIHYNLSNLTVNRRDHGEIHSLVRRFVVKKRKIRGRVGTQLAHGTTAP